MYLPLQVNNLPDIYFYNTSSKTTLSLEVLLQIFSTFVDFANAGYYLSSNRWFLLNYCAFQSSLFVQ